MKLLEFPGKIPLMLSHTVKALAAVFLIAGPLANTCVADDEFGVRSVLKDTGQYFTAPIRWDREDWAYFGVTLAVIAGAHEYDDNVRAHFTKGSTTSLDGANKHSLRDAAPALAIVGGTAVYAWFIRDQDGYNETWSLLEAGALSSVTGEVMKAAAGRERPNVSSSPDRWRSGGDSFPSLHSTAAFAVGTVFAESGNDEYRWIRRVIGYGVAAGTSYIRIHDNVHWLSDTVAGAALGIATARFVLNRHGAASALAGLQFGPMRDGWMLSYSLALN